MPITKPDGDREPQAAAEGATFDAADRTYTVAPSCGGDAGRWCCTDHPDAGLAHNWAKDSHCLTTAGPHRLVWVCFTHGPEVP